jgi:hypothetical protein
VIALKDFLLAFITGEDLLSLMIGAEYIAAMRVSN